MKTKEDIAVQMILLAWDKRVQEIKNTLAMLTDKDLNREVAATRNSGVWIIAHLAATNDSLIKILDLGEHIKPNYQEYFNMKGGEIELSSITEIRKYWEETSTHIAKRISELDTTDWFRGHTSISSEDFAKEPHRNKLNVVLDRTSHLAYHQGQLLLLTKK